MHNCCSQSATLCLPNAEELCSRPYAKIMNRRRRRRYVGIDRRCLMDRQVTASTPLRRTGTDLDSTNLRKDLHTGPWPQRRPSSLCFSLRSSPVVAGRSTCHPAEGNSPVGGSLAVGSSLVGHCSSPDCLVDRSSLVPGPDNMAVIVLVDMLDRRRSVQERVALDMTVAAPRVRYICSTSWA